MIIRKLTPDDWRLFKALRLAALLDAPDNFAQDHDSIAADPPETWRKGLAGRTSLAGFERDTPVALASYLVSDLSRMRHRATMINVWLDPRWRGAGRAEAMIRALEDTARGDGILQMELQVNAENARAVAFYERLGYRTIGRMPRAFRTPTGFVDDLIMVRAIDRT